MANMFRCTLASGGGALVLTVTCDSVFAGQTITCTDGTTTLTDTCPSTSPYTIEFSIPNGGIWTVSGVIEGQTISQSVTIEDSVTLEAIPEGSTALPTDNIQIWLHCAQIWNKSYTTISEVLNDATTVTTLIASNNAVDYMARSTTWASSVCADSSAMTKIGSNNYCANELLVDSTWLNAICNSTYFESVLNVKVPTMTSNTTPSGVVSCSTATGGTSTAYKAFDNNNSTYWGTANQGALPQWIQYKFTEQVKIFKLFTKTTGLNFLHEYSLNGSNDGTNFTNIGSFENTASTTDELTQVLSTSIQYQYFRLIVTSTYKGSASTNYAKIAEIQLYGRKDV